MGRYFFPGVLLESKQLAVEGRDFGTIAIKPDNILIGTYSDGFSSHIIELDTDEEHKYWESEYKIGIYIKRKFFTVSKEVAEKYQQ
jgi:hypothetical protein